MDVDGFCEDVIDCSRPEHGSVTCGTTFIAIVTIILCDTLCTIRMADNALSLRSGEVDWEQRVSCAP